MIRGGFLNAEDRRHLIALARDGSAAARLTRRANALVLLDDGWSCQEVAAAFLLPIAAIICPFGPPRTAPAAPTGAHGTVGSWEGTIGAMLPYSDTAGHGGRAKPSLPHSRRHSRHCS
jgi:hypothetical protein